MLRSVTATTDFGAGAGKRLGSWHVSAATVPFQVDFVDSATAAVYFTVHLATALTSASQAYAAPPYFPAGLKATLVAGTGRICVDLI